MVQNLIFGSGISFIISFSSLLIIARLFPLDFISDVKSITIYGGWFSAVFSGQVHSAFLFFYNKKGDQKESYKIFTFCYLLVAVILCSISFYFLFPKLYSVSNINKTGLKAFSMLIGFNLVFLVSPSIFTALSCSRKLPVLMFFYPFSQFISLILAYFFKMNVNQYAITISSISLLSFSFSNWSIYFIYALKSLPLYLSSFKKEFINYSLKISLSIIFETLGNRVDKILASKILEKVLFAKYSVLCFENPIVGILLNSYGVAMVKRFQGGVTGRVDEFLQSWEKMIRVITFVIFPISIFIINNHTWFIQTVFGKRYIDAGTVLLIYLFVSLIRFAPFQALLRLEGMVHYNVLMAISFFLTSVVTGSFIIIYGKGIKLIAFSYMSGWLIFNSLAIFFFIKASQINFWKIIGFKIWFYRLIQCFFSCFLSKLISGENIVINIVSFTIIYLCLVFYFDKVLIKMLYENYLVKYSFFNGLKK